MVRIGWLLANNASRVREPLPRSNLPHREVGSGRGEVLSPEGKAIREASHNMTE
jgi:hypothetical protein